MGTVTGKAAAGAGSFSVADPRPLPSATERCESVPYIVALDHTWHRPLTTLELAALQGYPVTQHGFALTGKSHSAWRNRIGNSVPVSTASAIASTMLHTLLLGSLNTGFLLSALPIWVRPLASALSVSSARGGAS